jgi:hypothetical protein
MRLDAPYTCERQHTDNLAVLVYRSSEGKHHRIVQRIGSRTFEEYIASTLA